MSMDYYQSRYPIESIINEYSIQESSEPARDFSRWRKPKKIAIQLQPNDNHEEIRLLNAFQQICDTIPLITFYDSLEPLTQHEDIDVVIGLADNRILKITNNIRWIHSYEVGVEVYTCYANIEDYPILLTNNQGLAANDTAQHAITFMLMLARGMLTYRDKQLQHQWPDNVFSSTRSSTLKNKCLLVIGIGNIGSEVARLASGLGMNVSGIGLSQRSHHPYVSHIGGMEDLHPYAMKADFIINCLPLTKKTKALIDKHFFDAAKPGAYYINIGRGETTVTEDLIHALEVGQLSGAGLDVIHPEPLPASHKIWSIDNTIITPHVAAVSADTWERGMAVALENTRRYIRGDKLLNMVDIQKGY